MQKETDDMKKWDMKSFTISDYNIVSVGADTIVSTYKVVVEGSTTSYLPLPELRRRAQAAAGTGEGGQP